MHVRGVIAGAVLLAACDKGGNGGSGGGPAIATGFRCFDLPGAERSDLRLLANGKHLAWNEHHRDGKWEDWSADFVTLDLATGKATVVEKNALDGLIVGDQVVFLRQTEKPVPGPPPSQRLFIKGAPVSPEGEAVTSLLADSAGMLYYTTYRSPRRQKDDTVVRLWKVAAGGGTPELLQDGFSVGAFANNGKTLIGTMDGHDRGENPYDLERIFSVPVAGGETTRLAVGSRFGVVGDRVVFEQHHDDLNSTLGVVKLPDGPAGPLPGAKPGSRLLQGGDQVFVIDREKGQPDRIISRTNGVAPITPIAHLVGVEVTSAVLLPDGLTLAALLVHDTNNDGHFEYGDEVDVCLIPTSRSPKAFTPPIRNGPPPT
jgi:hypothetical protein